VTEGQSVSQLYKDLPHNNPLFIVIEVAECSGGIENPRMEESSKRSVAQFHSEDDTATLRKMERSIIPDNA
jgi:hypothetical protein